MNKRILIALCCFVLAGLALAYGSKDRILLKDVTAITLKKGGWTASRRSNPVPQIKCVGGSASYGPQDLHPTTVQCVNTGFDGVDVQWRCDADLDERVRFGDIEVSCEGYNYPDDPYILVGSCGLEYKLEYTDKGVKNMQQQHQQQQESSWHRTPSSEYPRYSHDASESTSSSWFGSVISIIAFLMIIGAVISCCGAFSGLPSWSSAYAHTSEHHTGYNAYGAAVPPPSYGYQSSSYVPPPSSSSSGPGFWSGVATGAAASWLLRPRQSNNPYSHSSSSYSPPSYSGSSYRSSSSSSSSSGSSSRTSSGFGGTKRR